MVTAASIIAIVASFSVAATGVHQSSEIIVNGGRLRVQALSATLLRVEPLGARGFEDRTTFAVVNRSFAGVPIWKESETALWTVLSTKQYKVHLQGNVGVYWYVTDLQGNKIYEAVDDLARSNFFTGFHRLPNLLHWPSPLASKAYALVDSPRFFAPEWGPTPGPAHAIEPSLTKTNGFDFTNNVDGDTYVFLLGSTLQSWSAARAEFLQLTGPCPLIPDYAYGTWFTRWHNYTQAEAQKEVQQWDDLKLPIDVWGLDMNWRNTSSSQNSDWLSSIHNSDGSDWYYDHPDTVLFPNFTHWFRFLHKRKLKTYFNDHPYPVAARGAGGLQTSPEEVAFRWSGLTRWMQDGLDFWWFDRNWRFSIPPPLVNSSRTGADWEGLDNAVWGSYVFYKVAEVFGRNVSNKNCQACSNDPPLSLTKVAPADWRPGQDAVGHQEHPAHHRFPVWWTGDGVPLQASVESMVDAGVHGFKPFVHSDCGGDYRASGGDLLRWTAHCAFGTILRFHGEDHRPWSYGEHVTATIRKYLRARYKLMPSLIAAGRRATQTGFPLAARGDLYWPNLSPAAASNQQYIFLDDILVAPIWDTAQNITSRQVLIPPGSWQDVWDGSITTGPAKITVSQPFERQPMWHRRDGGLLVLASEPGTRVAEQDWSKLVLEAFPSSSPQNTTRTIYERRTGERTDVELATSDHNRVAVTIRSVLSRAWVIRLHLHPGDSAEHILVNGEESASVRTRHLHAAQHPSHDYFPFGGEGSLPAQHGGPIVEIHLPHARKHCLVEVTVHSKHEDSFFALEKFEESPFV